jgi:cellulose synthase/poly-beta-1,6-N-acetylglucosamine synthase-like glycosyltransferase
MLIWLIIISVVLILLYTLLIEYFYRGWRSLPKFDQYKNAQELKVSVIIPFRNESEIITKNLESLLRQDYPKWLLEIIYVNDHSSDDSVQILLEKVKLENHIELIHCSESETGKKSALYKGASTASGELLLFTDADCCPVAEWVSTMAAFYLEKQKPVLISGPVLIESRRGLFNKMQSLELLSLTASAAGSFGAGTPILCSAANLGIKRIQYLEYFSKIRSELASGDDIFMLLAFKKTFPGRLHFIKSNKAVVYTSPIEKIGDFFKQRIRWASKARFYKDPWIVMTSGIVFFVNFLLLALLFSGFARHEFLLIFVLVFFLKSVSDFRLLVSVSTFFREQHLMALFLSVQLLYPFYAVIAGLGGMVIRTKWKGRK